ncbi:glucosamine-6-phosphate deaminase [Alkalihalobacillus sp. 1P02AB]|uniref:glucosamine-6-phosphate deaminase n=1 Tax=Alkalihalobacillus sp. 1P02AB TaxID=3132260 RepID=UPI0039A4C9F3
MKIVETTNYQEMSEKAASFLINQVKEKPNATLGMATGGTPEGMYQLLIEDYNQNGTSYKEVTTFNLDEYIGLPKEDKNSYNSYMHNALFNFINIPESQIHLPNGMNADAAKECEKYEERIARNGGIDIQILGIGENGHIGFNEPGTSFDSKTHVITLTESTRIANSRYFNSLDEVPTKAVTMGISTIMQAKKIILLASGEKKADALHQLLHNEVDESFPASILQKHPNVTIIADRDALKNISVTSA